MKTVSKSELKSKMLEYFRIIERTGEELIVTSHGLPTLKVVPLYPKSSIEDVFSDIREKVQIDDSIMEPETEEWGDVL